MSGNSSISTVFFISGSLSSVLEELLSGVLELLLEELELLSGLLELLLDELELLSGLLELLLDELELSAELLEELELSLELLEELSAELLEELEELEELELLSEALELFSAELLLEELSPALSLFVLHPVSSAASTIAARAAETGFFIRLFPFVINNVVIKCLKKGRSPDVPDPAALPSRPRRHYAAFRSCRRPLPRKSCFEELKSYCSLKTCLLH